MKNPRVTERLEPGFGQDGCQGMGEVQMREESPKMKCDLLNNLEQKIITCSCMANAVLVLVVTHNILQC